MKDWKWTQDPKTLLWIIGALVFPDMGVFAEAVLPSFRRLVELGLKGKSK